MSARYPIIKSLPHAPHILCFWLNEWNAYQTNQITREFAMALGISLGTQRSGIAIIKGRELVIKEMLYCNPISGRHVQELRRYIKQYSVSAVIIKLPPSTHITAQMNDILRSITTTCKQFGCIIEYANHRSIKGCDMKNQEDIIRKVVSLYPDLLIEQQKQEASKNRYYIKLFEAVLAAHQLLHTNAV